MRKFCCYCGTVVDENDLLCPKCNREQEVDHNRKQEADRNMDQEVDYNMDQEIEYNMDQEVDPVVVHRPVQTQNMKIQPKKKHPLMIAGIVLGGITGLLLIIIMLANSGFFPSSSHEIYDALLGRDEIAAYLSANHFEEFMTNAYESPDQQVYVELDEQGKVWNAIILGGDTTLFGIKIGETFTYEKTGKKFTSRGYALLGEDDSTITYFADIPGAVKKVILYINSENMKVKRIGYLMERLEESKDTMGGADIDSSFSWTYQLFENLQENEVIPYYLNDKASTFLKEQEQLFPVASINSIPEELIDDTIDYRHILKNDTKYGDKLMIFPVLEVVQIFETEIADQEYLTEIITIDPNGQQYYIFYIGELEQVFENDTISVCALPLGSSSFQNTDGGETLAVVFAGSYISLTESDYLQLSEFSSGSEGAEYAGNTEYILPYSDIQILTDHDLVGLSAEQLRIATNEIYARHGRKFNDQQLQAYFNSKSWYRGTVSPENFNESVLSQTEKNNIVLIQKKRDGLGK